jgi:response regulator RpfG family c-di-GMP phosphodiesterase
MKHKILMVDDEPANLRVLERLFKHDCDVVTAGSGPEGLELLERHSVSLIISDQRMPGMTGIEFLKKAALLRPHTTRIILTGYTDVEDLVEAINSGVVYRYVTKPWINDDLKQVVKRALDHYDVTKKQHRMSIENERLEKRLSTNVRAFVEALTDVAYSSRPEVRDHCRRTSDHAVLIGELIGMHRDEIEQLRCAALLHELPNLAFDQKTFLEGAASDTDQSRLIQATYQEGLRPISSIPDLEDVATIIEYQHERFDGAGSLYGLAGDAIPTASRILAAANTVEEIRTLDEACSDNADSATEQLRTKSGRELDPAFVELCIETCLAESLVA